MRGLADEMTEGSTDEASVLEGGKTFFVAHSQCHVESSGTGSREIHSQRGVTLLISPLMYP